MSKGKKLYGSTSMPSIKVMAFTISFVLLLNLYYQTFNDPIFIQSGSASFSSVVDFHVFYPEDLILYILTILIPSIYYGFIRGVRFYDSGILINKGLPFFNTFINYSDIKNFEIINKKHFVSIKLKDTEDEFMFTVNSIDRVLAIFDQQHISGDLGAKAKSDSSAHKKLVLIFLVFGIIFALIQHFGLMRFIFR